MMNHMFLDKLTTNTTFSGYYCLTNLQQRATRGGKPYLSMQLSDVSGAMAAVQWDTDRSAAGVEPGTIVYAEGTVGSYKNMLQLTLLLLRPETHTDVGNYDIREIIPEPPEPPVEVIERVNALLYSMQDQDLHLMCDMMFSTYYNEFCTYPAGQRMHHAYPGGLLIHTERMMQHADRIATLYPDLVNRDLLLAGTFLHDFGKVLEFDISPLGIMRGYTPQGSTLGHPAIAYGMLQEMNMGANMPEDKLMALGHMILSHHGSAEHGAAVQPQTPEARILCAIDALDADLDKYRTAFAGLAPGEVGGYLPGTNHVVYRHTLPVGQRVA